LATATDVRLDALQVDFFDTVLGEHLSLPISAVSELSFPGDESPERGALGGAGVGLLLGGTFGALGGSIISTNRGQAEYGSSLLSPVGVVAVSAGMLALGGAVIGAVVGGFLGQRNTVTVRFR
jgi:hypothetical protein